MAERPGRAVVNACLTAMRPQALGALLRYFRDLDQAQEAFQNACVSALRHWPERGLPRDPAAWLIVAGRNAGIDEQRRRARLNPLSQEVESGEAGGEAMVDEVESLTYRDDTLRLFFVCCHPQLAPVQQIALALRIVAGLSVAEIARAFLVQPRTVEQRITRAKRRIRDGGIPFDTPSSHERSQRLHTVCTMVYLLFNEGYSASGGDAHIRSPLCDEAIRLGRLLLRMFPGVPELMGLLALCLLQHARNEARLNPRGEIVLLEDQDRTLWNRPMIDEGALLVEKALRHRAPGPLQVQAAIAATHARAARAQETDWQEIERLYRALEQLQPSPVVTLNRAVAVSKTGALDVALTMVNNLAEPLSGYFHFHGVRGALCAELGDVNQARAAFERALDLAGTAAEVNHIRYQLARLG